MVRSGLNIGFLKFQVERVLLSTKSLECFCRWGYEHTSKYCHREELCRKYAEHPSSTNCANCSLAHEANNVNCLEHVERKGKNPKVL